jgi:outer membrane murein-binding lipoprotein Lpp
MKGNSLLPRQRDGTNFLAVLLTAGFVAHRLQSAGGYARSSRLANIQNPSQQTVFHPTVWVAWLGGIILSLFLAGCGGSNETDSPLAESPEQAASQIEQAFSDADNATRQVAAAASEALRKGEYEKAIVSLETVRDAPDVTPDQGLAIYNSTVALEQRLISAMEAGDKNAERAYQMLKAFKRK